MKSKGLNSGKLGYNRIARAGMVIFFILFCIIIMLPFISMILTSFKPSDLLMRDGFNLSFNREIMTAENYKTLFTTENNYFRWYRNSIVLTAIQVVLTLIVSAWVGYGFAFYRFKGKGFLFTCVLLIMMVPFEILMLPLYVQINSLGLINSIWGIMLPYLAHAMAIFFFRQYLKGIPKDIIDAGRVDGCSEYGIFLRLILPIMRPALAAMAILIGVFSWNNYLWPLLVLSNPAKFTLPIGLNALVSPYGSNYQLLVAGSVISVIPVLILFLCAQKNFIAGMTSGSVKG
jgi:arabinosaccharide transport system permease protein